MSFPDLQKFAEHTAHHRLALSSLLMQERERSDLSEVASLALPILFADAEKRGMRFTDEQKVVISSRVHGGLVAGIKKIAKMVFMLKTVEDIPDDREMSTLLSRMQSGREGFQEVREYLAMRVGDPIDFIRKGLSTDQSIAREPKIQQLFLNECQQQHCEISSRSRLINELTDVVFKKFSDMLMSEVMEKLSLDSSRSTKMREYCNLMGINVNAGELWANYQRTVSESLQHYSNDQITAFESPQRSEEERGQLDMIVNNTFTVHSAEYPALTESLLPVLKDTIQGLLGGLDACKDTYDTSKIFSTNMEPRIQLARQMISKRAEDQLIVADIMPTFFARLQEIRARPTEEQKQAISAAVSEKLRVKIKELMSSLFAIKSIEFLSDEEVHIILGQQTATLPLETSYSEKISKITEIIVQDAKRQAGTSPELTGIFFGESSRHHFDMDPCDRLSLIFADNVINRFMSDFYDEKVAQENLTPAQYQNIKKFILSQSKDRLEQIILADCQSAMCAKMLQRYTNDRITELLPLDEWPQEDTEFFVVLIADTLEFNKAYYTALFQPLFESVERTLQGLIAEVIAANPQQSEDTRS